MENTVRFSAAFALLLSIIPLSFAQADDRTIVVLDASGSMWGQIDGRSKIEIARETIDKVLPSVSKDSELGLMVYGHRDKGSCADIELVVPPARDTGAKIADVVNGITPKGKTPLTQAVREAADALKYTEEKATVVLVTDGLETCEADPCALARELESKGVDFTAHVVGFGLTLEEGKKVSCLAEGTGGQYFQASDAGQLVAALAATVAAPPAVKAVPAAETKPVKLDYNVMLESVLSEGGPVIGESGDIQWKIFKAGANGEPEGDYIALEYKGSYSATYPAGKYIAVATLDGSIERKAVFEIRESEVVKPRVNFDAGSLIITPKRTPQDTEADSNAAVLIGFGDHSTTYYGVAKFYATAGNVSLKGTIGPATAEESVSVKAGETVEHDLVIGSGVIDNKAVYAEGGLAVDSPAVFFEILSQQKDINGDRERFSSTYGTGSKLDTPVGDFILAARLGLVEGETPFTIKAGERRDVTVNLNAGVIAITAPGADKIEILEAKKDIQGKQKNLTTAYGVEHTETVSPGAYIVRASYKGDQAPKDMPATVKAAERTEVTMQ
jgi:Ca-activated chloride channel family protein